VAVLTAANLGVTIYARLPFEGGDARSVFLSIVSGTSKSPGVGMYGAAPSGGTGVMGRAVMDTYRLQVDCNFDDREGCAELADAVEQAIWEAHDDLRDNHDIHGLQKILDVDALALGQSVRMPVLTREARVIQDYTFWTHRQLAS
jgi:hypothetical protein